jgi:hypothetical protein
MHENVRVGTAATATSQVPRNHSLPMASQWARSAADSSATATSKTAFVEESIAMEMTTCGFDRLGIWHSDESLLPTSAPFESKNANCQN